MRTEELMRKYQTGDFTRPKDGWQCLVWHAADLIKLAKEMRGTDRTVHYVKSNLKQGELF